MHIAPELVLPLSEAGPGQARKFKLKGLREKWAWAPREWLKVTDDTGDGNPAAATAEKGKKFLDAVADQISGFLVELAAADLEDMYEVARLVRQPGEADLTTITATLSVPPPSSASVTS